MCAQTVVGFAYPNITKNEQFIKKPASPLQGRQLAKLFVLIQLSRMSNLKMYYVKLN